MARFDFQSPGAAYTEQIADVLAQRKAQERQQMLDQLTANADMRAQEASARQAEEHKAQMAAHQQSMLAAQQQQELSRLGALEAPLDVDEDPTSRGYTPEDIAILQKYGRLKQNDPNAGLSAEDRQVWGEENLAQARTGYVGTAQQRERKRLQGQSADLITGIMQDPSKREVGSFLQQIAAANDGILPPDVLAQYAGPGAQVIMFNEATGKFTDMEGKPVDGKSLPPNAKIIQRGYAPTSYYQDPAMQYSGQDPDNPNMQIFIRRDGTVVKVPGVRGAAASSGNKGLDALGIPATILDDIQLAEGSLGVDPRSVDESALGGYRGIMVKAFGNSKIGSRPVKQLATEYLHNPDAAANKVVQMFGEGKLTQKDIDDFMLITSSVPEHVKEILNKNPFVPNKQKPRWWEGIFSSGKDEGDKSGK